MSLLKRFLLLAGLIGSQIAAAQSQQAEPAQYPLFLSNPVIPIMMLNMSKDHQLFFKVYDDYADITSPTGGAPDGIPDITYNNNYKYYGYFDENKCYTYNTTSNHFTPSRRMTNNYCNASVSNEWSGNFLNWATMTRMDAVRKILYGGYRQVDTGTNTVLRRAMLPNDAHSFAKYYNGADVARLVPFTTIVNSPSDMRTAGLTICNTTNGGSLLSHNVTSPPLIRVAKGNYMFWASNERFQCLWRDDISNSANGINGNDQSVTGIPANSDSPKKTTALGTGSAAGEYRVDVNVCVANLEESNCVVYPSGNKKPVGLLQRYGESGRINFGLMTGSFLKSKDGGVLRKQIGSISDEIETSTNGTFKSLSASTPGIIKTLNRLTIYGYRFSDGTYHNNSHSNPGADSHDGCLWSQNSFSNGQCTNWGNPQAEIYLESLRYLAGKSANAAFSISGDDKIPGLISSAWGSAPVNAQNYCAPLNILQFNASTTSYDGDQLGSFSDITSTTIDSLTNKIGDVRREDLNGQYFVGSNGSSSDQLCTPKLIANLASVRGTCPDAPRLDGSYHIAGMAYYARRNDILPNLKGEQTVRTFGVALAPALPKISVTIPTRTSSITLMPACRNTLSGRSMNCAIVDFKVISQENGVTIASNAYGQSDVRRVLNGKVVNRGSLYVNWEDSEQGGDYDQDMWGLIEYAISSTDVVVSTRIIKVSTGDPMGFGYVISGTNSDGFQVHSGINNFSATGCVSCNLGQNNSSPGGVSHKTYTIGTSDAKFLETPLYYAAKWGGYDEDFVKEAKKQAGTSYSVDYLDDLVKDRDIANSYWFATDPRSLEESLDKAFKEISSSVGSASAVATNAKRASDGNFVFQALFNSENWTGVINIYEFNQDGNIKDVPSYTSRDLGVMPTAINSRNVYTSTIVNGVHRRMNFTTSALSADQKERIKLRNSSGTVIDTDTVVDQRINWIRGSSAAEGAQGLRDRGTGSARNILGDIVNSGPVYVGVDNHRYHTLSVGGNKYANYLKDKAAWPARLYIGANDGMLHAFNAPTAAGGSFEEVFAYVPSGVYGKLAKLSEQSYGTTDNPHVYTVDGDVVVGDVYDPDDGEWRTVLIGSLGAGGRGLYALDITDPDAPDVLWEISSANYPALGYVTGQVHIVPMRNGRFAAIFGNGVSSGSTSSLFVLDILDLSRSKVLTASEGVGLSTPALLPNRTGQVIAAYAGDVNGNLWKFDLSDDNAASWALDRLMFKAVYTRANNTTYAQPITGSPTLGLNFSLDGAVMVYFGTGKYIDTGDNTNTATNVESFYAIADVGARVPYNKLHVRQMTTNMNTTPPSRTVNVMASNGSAIDWATQQGWVIHFSNVAGERVTSKPLLIQDRLIFSTVIPSQVSCEFGGNSWMMDIAAVGDRSNYDERYINESIIGGNMYNNYMILGDLSFVLNGDNASIIGSATTTKLTETPAELIKAYTGRQSWRQVK